MPDATLLLIPGLLCDGVVWQPLVERLGRKAVIADLRKQESITQMAEDCLSLAKGDLIIAGHSMGARVAMEIARLAPDRVRRMALLDTGMHPLKEGEKEKREAAIQFAHAEGMQALADSWVPGMVHEPNHANQPLMQALNDMVLRMDADIHARQINALVTRPNAESYVESIQCPVLLVVGREDAWSPVAQHQDMHAAFPDSRLEIIDNAGHFSLLERPDEVAEIVAGFLTEETP